ncbi:MAG: FAD-dependent oxidoreductase [Acidobacteriota bacterium]
MPRPSISPTDPATASVTVVGGGLAGLTAAAELATAGRAVTVFEAADQLGGRATTREHGRFRFNLGPRALYARGAGRRILERLSVPYRGHPPALDRPLAWIDDTLAPLPSDFWSLVTCRWMSWRERLDAARFLAGLGRVDPRALCGQTAAEWLADCVRHPASRRLADALLRLATYSNQPESLDASVAARQLQLAFRGGVLYLDGGWRTLVDGLRSVAVAAGARIETGRRIVRVAATPTGSWSCCTAAGDTVAASAVVLAVGPRQADRLLGAVSEDADDDDDSARYAAACRPVFAACLDVALDRLPRPERTFVQGIDRPLYVSVHSAAADLAPEGGALLHALRYLRDGERPSRDAIRDELESVLDRVQPGWRDHLVERQLLPHMRVCHDLPSPERDRAAVRVDDGLMVAGDWVGPELLADASITSGYRAARALLDESITARSTRIVA